MHVVPLFTGFFNTLIIVILNCLIVSPSGPSFDLVVLSVLSVDNGFGGVTFCVSHRIFIQCLLLCMKE